MNVDVWKPNSEITKNPLGIDGVKNISEYKRSNEVLEGYATSLRKFLNRNGAGANLFNGENATFAKQDGIYAVVGLALATTAEVMQKSSFMKKNGGKLNRFTIAFGIGYTGGTLYRVYGDHKGKKTVLKQYDNK